MSPPTPDPAEPEVLTFAEFLETVPPGQTLKVRQLAEPIAGANHRYRKLQTPQLLLHCTSSECNGPRYFRFKEGDAQFELKTSTFLNYVCSNCRRTNKAYSIHVMTASTTATDGTAFKYGELPAFGPATPTRLLKLLGDERETFLKGRRCENQGLGIGAFAYYRRVVETQKDRILDEIIKVSNKLGASKDAIEQLNAAKAEHQFNKAVTSVKLAIPQTLLINGANPLTLLHAALSVGVHNLSDEKCLEMAQDIRVVLAELSDKLSQAIKDEAELTTAVSRLMRARDPEAK